LSYGKPNQAKKVASFSVGIPTEQENETTWENFSVEAWEGTAEACAERLTKGSKILLLGVLKQDRWETNEGTQSRVFIRASYVEFLRIKEAATPDAH
jgi:single-stranded DNA-binding protein